MTDTRKDGNGIASKPTNSDFLSLVTGVNLRAESWHDDVVFGGSLFER